jgi:hypothetical protein
VTTHPIIAAIEARRQKLGVPAYILAKRAGFHESVIAALPHASRPNLYAVDAAAGAVGLKLSVEPIFAKPINFMRWSGRR